MERKTKPLQRVVLEYPITIIDTSALLSPLDGCPKKEDESNEARILNSQMIFDSAIFYRNFFESGGRFCVTPKVLEEYSFGDYVSRKQKELDKRGYLPRRDFELFEARKIDDEERAKLINILNSEEMVLQLTKDEREEYGYFDRKYDHVKSKRLISDVDFDFLIFGVVLLKMRNQNVSLVSNDFGILYSWVDIINEEKIKPEKLGFFLREECDVFGRAYL